MARFHVRDTFAIRDKNLFVLAGFVIEGEIKSGMLVRLPFSGTIQMTEPIAAVERAKGPDGDVVCLCLNCGSDQEAAVWEALKLKDRTVDIAPAP